MGLSNPDRASATSIYTHVARLFIPRYPHALNVLSASHCMSCQLELGPLREAEGTISRFLTDEMAVALNLRHREQ
jgi:hypothetical protein